MYSMRNFLRTSFHIDEISQLPSWEPALEMLKEVEGKPVGRSSAGNIATILHMIRLREIENSNILTFFYDDLKRYDQI